MAEKRLTTAGTRVAAPTLSMPTDMTVVVADATQAPAIRGGLPLSGRVAWYTDTNLAQAIASIQMNHPRVIAWRPGSRRSRTGKRF